MRYTVILSRPVKCTQGLLIYALPWAAMWLTLCPLENMQTQPCPWAARYRLVTKDEVLHAEMNAIAKVSSSTESSEDATLFVTHAPCIHCAKAIYQSGIKNIFYREAYRDTKGLEFLEQGGVNVTKYSIQD